MSQDFQAARAPKVFQCQFENANPEFLLDVSAEALAQIRDGSTGKSEWRVDKSLRPVRDTADGWQLFHTTSPVPGSPVISLTCLAIPISEPRPQYQARIRRPRRPRTGDPVPGGRPPLEPPVAYLCQFVAHFEGRGWEIPGNELSVDFAMLAMAGALQAEWPENTGWEMLQGRWQIHHRFQAKDQATKMREAEDAVRRAEQIVSSLGLPKLPWE